MKYMQDIVEAVGLLAIGAGVWSEFGWGAACIVVGSIMLAVGFASRFKAHGGRTHGK